MKRVFLLLSISIIFSGCLKAKKSPFDISSPSTGFFVGFVSLNTAQNNAANTATTGTPNTTTNSQTFSISGTITGFTSGTLILQNNGKDDLTVTAPTSQYSFSGISSGTSYSILPKSHPSGLVCKIDNTTGTITANVTNANITCSIAKANPLYTLGDATKSYWLDYVKSDGTSPLNATGTACTGSETGFYNACIHAGELRQISIPNFTSCDGITTTDSLTAFNWKCTVATDGSVSVISTGLRGDKGLSDLIDFTSPGSFRNNTVTVLLNGNSFLTTTPAKWWDNAIAIANNGIAANAGVSKTIYIITDGTSITNSYNLDKSKLALLVNPNIYKVYTGPGNFILLSNSFLWVEGNFENLNSQFSNMLTNPGGLAFKFSVLRNINIQGDTNWTVGLLFNQASNQSIYIHRVKISNSNIPFNLNVNGVIVNGLTAFNGSGLSANGFTQSDMIVNSILFSNFGGTAFLIGSGYNSNLLQNITIASNGSGNAVSLSGPIKTSLINLASVNNLNAGMNVGGATNFTQSINLSFGHNGADYNESAPGSSNSGFKGNLKVRGTCTVVGTNPGITNSTCLKINNGYSDVTTVAQTGAGIDFTNSFAGSASSDSSNAIGSTGSANFGSISGRDWYNFQNQFRTWGKNGTFPSSAIQGQCTVGCRIWDWSLKSTDSVIRNVNACPNGTIVDTHQWSDSSAPNQAYCDANYKGSKISGTTCITTFLRNAVEIFGDGVGNENGICESGEECLYTPNIGAYQGHSSDATNPYKLVKADTASTTNSNLCSDVGTGGTVTNVTLWKYEVNGY